MTLKDFIYINLTLHPIEIIKKAKSLGWNDEALFEELKENREYLNDEDGRFVVIRIYDNLVIPTKFENWLEKRVVDTLNRI